MPTVNTQVPGNLVKLSRVGYGNRTWRTTPLTANHGVNFGSRA
jgi:hypothetical protein